VVNKGCTTMCLIFYAKQTHSTNLFGGAFMFCYGACFCYSYILQEKLAQLPTSSHQCYVGFSRIVARAAIWRSNSDPGFVCGGGRRRRSRSRGDQRKNPPIRMTLWTSRALNRRR